MPIWKKKSAAKPFQKTSELKHSQHLKSDGSRIVFTRPDNTTDAQSPVELVATFDSLVCADTSYGKKPTKASSPES